MMNRTTARPLKVLWLAFVLLPLIAASQAGPVNNNGEKGVIEGIKNGNGNFILKAGDSGNQTYIPYLKAIYHGKPKRPEVDAFVQLALAKLGDRDALGEVYCELMNGSYEDARSVFDDKLPYIGGWFSVRITDDAIEERISGDRVSKDKAPDVVTVSLQSLALYSAPEWMPGIKGQRIGVLEWREYFSSNREKLATLEPRGLEPFAHLPQCPKSKKRRHK